MWSEWKVLPGDPNAAFVSLWDLGQSPPFPEHQFPDLKNGVFQISLRGCQQHQWWKETCRAKPMARIMPWTSWILDTGAKEWDLLQPPETESQDSWSQWESMQNWVHSPALPLPICVALRKSSSPSEPKVKMRTVTSLPGCWWGDTRWSRISP